MRTSMKRYVAAATAMVLLAGVSTAVAKSSHPKIAPPTAKIEGKTYGEWSAAWWQWALALPQDNHPFFDTSDYDGTAGQTGKVWFLAGAGSATRDITIPKGTRLFVALANAEASNLEVDPFYGGTAEEQLAAASAFADYIVDPFCEVDGVALDDVGDYRFTSPQFEFTVPNPNILFVDYEGSGTSVSDGYWAMIGPLSKGTHTVRFGGAFVGSPFDFAIDTTYDVTVR